MTALVTTGEAGRIIGPYRILGRVGAGGFADVYTALPVETADRLGTSFKLDPAQGALVPAQDAAGGIPYEEWDREGRPLAPGGAAERIVPVALKVARPGGEDELRRGARTQAALDHDGVARVLALGLEHDPPFVALAWARGGSLRDVLARRGRLAPAEALRVADRVLAVLSHAHGRGIVHGDVKPENVLVDAGTGPLEERIRLTDFGLRRRIARRAAGAAGSVSLAPSMASASVAAGAGTPDYISPEVAAGAEGDRRMDVFACGVLVFELVTGRRPSGFDLPSDLIPSLPREIDAIVKEAMRSDPARRFPSADAMRLAIRDALPRRAVRHAPGLRPETGELFSQALAVFRLDRWPLFVASAIGHVLGALSLGILEAPVDAAICLSVRDAFEGRPSRFMDRLSEAIPRTLTLVLAMWLQLFFVLLGLILFVVPGLYLAARWLYVTPAIVFEGKGLRAALRRSAELAHAGGIGRHMGIAGILLVLGVLLSSFSWVGGAVLGPLSWGVAVAGYLRLSR